MPSLRLVRSLRFDNELAGFILDWTTLFIRSEKYPGVTVTVIMVTIESVFAHAICFGKTVGTVQVHLWILVGSTKKAAVIETGLVVGNPAAVILL